MYKIFIVISFFFFFSCAKKKELPAGVNSVLTEKEVRYINLNPYDKGYAYDDLIDSVSFVKLETTDKNLIGAVNQLFFINDKIVVIDKEVSKSITVYDKVGKFLYKVSRMGNGPGEYNYLNYVTPDYDKSGIVLVDMMAKKLKFYTLDDRLQKLIESYMIKSVDLPYALSHVEFLSPEVVAGYYSVGNYIPGTSDKHKFMVAGLDGQVLYSGYESYYNKKFTLTTEFPLRRFGDNVYFNPSFSDTIFKVSPSGLEVSYILNIKGSEKLKQNENITQEEFDRLLEQSNYFNGYFVDLKDAAMFHYMSDTDYSSWGMYLKSENKVYDCNGKCKDPLLGFCHIPWHYYADNTVVKAVSANWILSYKEDFLKKSDSGIVKPLLKDLTEDDNPVLLFYHMKTIIK